MVVNLPPSEIVVDQLAMPEAPRWHQGALYFSDVWNGRVTYKFKGPAVFLEVGF